MRDNRQYIRFEHYGQKDIIYSEIKWEGIDYTKVTTVVDICRAIKEYYWNNRPYGSYRSALVEVIL